MSDKWKTRIKTFLVAEDGPTTVEYVILLSLMVGMMIASLWYVRAQAVGLGQDITTGLETAGFGE